MRLSGLCVCAFPLVLWLMAVLEQLDGAFNHPCNKDREEKRDIAV